MRTARAARLAAFAAALSACTEAPVDLTGVRAGEAARAQGVEAYDVLQATAHDLDVRLVGRPAGRLRVHSVDGQTVQRLEGSTRLTLTTSRTRMTAEGTDGRSRVVAEMSDGVWRAPESTDAATERALEVILAVDVDLAVQGSSVVFGGAALARCSEVCDRAARCAAERFTAERCAPNAVRCAACLEQEP